MSKLAYHMSEIDELTSELAFLRSQNHAEPGDEVSIENILSHLRYHNRKIHRQIWRRPSLPSMDDLVDSPYIVLYFTFGIVGVIFAIAALCVLFVHIFSLL